MKIAEELIGTAVTCSNCHLVFQASDPDSVENQMQAVTGGANTIHHVKYATWKTWVIGIGSLGFVMIVMIGGVALYFLVFTPRERAKSLEDIAKDHVEAITEVGHAVRRVRNEESTSIVAETIRRKSTQIRELRRKLAALGPLSATERDIVASGKAQSSEAMAAFNDEMKILRRSAYNRTARFIDRPKDVQELNAALMDFGLATADFDKMIDAALK